MITAEQLRAEIESLERQRQQAADTVQQAIGAISLARALLAQLENAPVTVNEFAQAVGGPGARAEVATV